MKTKTLIRYALALFALAFAFPLFAMAQDAAPAGPASLPDSVVAWLTPIIVPLVLAATKQFVPKLPSWALPLTAPVLGFLIGVINNVITHNSGNLWLAAGLGLLGVAVREVKEAIKPAPNGGWPGETP